MSTQEDNTFEPVSYKPVDSDSIEEATGFQCQICLEIRDIGELVFHAAMRHGTSKTVINTTKKSGNT